MDPKRLFERAVLGLRSDQGHEFFMLQYAFDDPDTIRPLGMAGAVVVRKAGGMGKQQSVQFWLTNRNSRFWPENRLRKLARAAADAWIVFLRSEHRANRRACPTKFTS